MWDLESMFCEHRWCVLGRGGSQGAVHGSQDEASRCTNCWQQGRERRKEGSGLTARINPTKTLVCRQMDGKKRVLPAKYCIEGHRARDPSGRGMSLGGVEPPPNIGKLNRTSLGVQVFDRILW